MMRSRRQVGDTQSVPRAIAESVREQMFQKQAHAAAWFESRWTLRSLARTDPELHERLLEQLDLFHDACLRGTDAQIAEQGAAMVRGWMAAVRRMEQSGEPDDAYAIGSHESTVVAISAQRSAEARVREKYGPDVVFLTPDEVAAMFAGLQGVGDVKRLWPGAEIVEARGKGDG